MGHFHNTVEHVEKEIRDMKDDEVPEIDIEMAISRRYPEVSGDVIKPKQPGTKPSSGDDDKEEAARRHADIVMPGDVETPVQSDAASVITKFDLQPSEAIYDEDVGQATVIFESPQMAVKWIYLVESPYEPMILVNMPGNSGWVEMSRNEVGPNAKTLDARALNALGNKYPSFMEDVRRHYNVPNTSWGAPTKMQA